MARRYVSYLERIAKAKTQEQREKLLKEAESVYGKSYVEEYFKLLLLVRQKYKLN